VALDPPRDDGVARVADALLWIAASTPIDAWPAIDEALGDRAARLWSAAAEALERSDAGSARLSRPQQILAAHGLAQSTSPRAATLRASLSASLRDPTLRAILSVRPSAARPRGAAVAAGEIVAPPRSAPALFLLVVTGILPIVALARLVGRFALRIRRPAELVVDHAGVTVKSRTEVLGRTLRQRELHIPTPALARAAREVRFPRAALYAGVASLVVGSYLGLRLFIDGFRAGSLELLGIGAGMVLLGLVVDYALSHVGVAAKGRCRVLFEPRRGDGIAVADVDPDLADAALLRLQGGG
jgi:hypothetical protein